MPVGGVTVVRLSSPVVSQVSHCSRLPIQNNPNQYRSTLPMHLFLKAMCTRTRTQDLIIHKQARDPEKLLHRASQYKTRRHILQPEFMSCYLLCGRERT